jgi:hypothetical protein
MTHNLEQNHGHSHDHSHKADSSDSHTDEMTLEQKLEKLLGHWIEHNDSHKETFFTWAQRAETNDMAPVAEKIRQAGQLSEQVTQLLKDALNKLTQ